MDDTGLLCGMQRAMWWWFGFFRCCVMLVWVILGENIQDIDLQVHIQID